MTSFANPLSRPELAGLYWDWETEDKPTTPPSTAAIEAVVGEHDWGPANVPTLCTSWPDFTKKFDTSMTDLAVAVYGAFRGEAVNGRGGAGAVLVYRIGATSGGSALHKATLALSNTTPVVAVTLTALQPGTKGNTIAATVQPGAASGTTELILLVDGSVEETYVFPSTTLDVLVAAINLKSSWVSATLGTNGVALASVSAVAFATGADGSPAAGGDWTLMTGAMDQARFAGLAPANLTDPVILASLKAWAADRNSRGLRFWFAEGGVSNEAQSAASARAQAINGPNVLVLGMGLLHDDLLDLDLTSAQLAARYLGARLARGEAADDFYVRFADLSVAQTGVLATLDEQVSAINTGLIVFSVDSDPTAPIFIREAVTSYSDDSASPRLPDGTPQQPVKLWKRVKNIATQQAVEREAMEWATAPGGPFEAGLAVDDKGRGLVIGYFKTLYQKRVDGRIIQAGFSVALATDVPQTDDDDFMVIDHGFHPIRSVRQIFNRVRMG